MLNFVEFITFERMTEIRFYDGFIPDNLCRRTGTYHPSVIDYVGLIDHLQRPLDVMVGN